MKGKISIPIYDVASGKLLYYEYYNKIKLPLGTSVEKACSDSSKQKDNR